MQEKIRIGLIGAGANMEAVHLPKLATISDVSVVGVVNRTAVSGQRVAQKWSIPRVFETAEHLINDRNIDAVVIGTWPDSHERYSVDALRAGKHVLCEARMTTDERSAQRMRDVARSAKRIAHLVPAPTTMHVDDDIRSSLIASNFGELRSVTVYHQMDIYSGGQAWRRAMRYSGRNILSTGIVYETLRRWLPPLEWLVATTNPDYGGGVDLPDTVDIVGKDSAGVCYSMLLRGQVTQQPKSQICLEGTKARLLYRFASGSLSWQELGNEKNEVIKQGNAYEAWSVEQTFVDAIRGRESSKALTFEDGFDYMRFVDTVWTSLVDGEPRGL
jgi:predicted dehydrogenase